MTSQIALRRHLAGTGVLFIAQALSSTAGHTERMNDNRELGYVLADNREGVLCCWWKVQLRQQVEREITFCKLHGFIG